jgi:uncharacterized membrane protein SpoIIM required for sporulation
MSVIRALRRARLPILAVALTYAVSLLAGMVMVHASNSFAVSFRDSLVTQAQTSPVLEALHKDDRLRAALLDFGGNLYAAVADTLGGLGLVFPFPFIAYRGWVGGIVSIDSAHASRLANHQEALYYLTTLVLQLIPYALSGGAGVNMGLALWRPKPYYAGPKWLTIPSEAVRDVLRIYLIVVPLFLLASLWEFLVR